MRPPPFRSANRPVRWYGLDVWALEGVPQRKRHTFATDPLALEYTSVLFTPGAIGWGMSEPRVAEGTEIESKPSADNGGGQQILHSRVNLAIHPAAFTWTEAAVVGESPTIAELTNPANWDRVVERKAAGLAFLKTKL